MKKKEKEEQEQSAMVNRIKRPYKEGAEPEEWEEIQTINPTKLGEKRGGRKKLLNG